MDKEKMMDKLSYTDWIQRAIKRDAFVEKHKIPVLFCKSCGLQIYDCQPPHDIMGNQLAIKGLCRACHKYGKTVVENTQKELIDRQLLWLRIGKNDLSPEEKKPLLYAYHKGKGIKLDEDKTAEKTEKRT